MAKEGENPKEERKPTAQEGAEEEDEVAGYILSSEPEDEDETQT